MTLHREGYPDFNGSTGSYGELAQHGFRPVKLDANKQDIHAPGTPDDELLDTGGDPDHRFTVTYDCSGEHYVVESHAGDSILGAVEQLEDDGELTIALIDEDEGRIMVIPNLQAPAEHDVDEPIHTSGLCRAIAELITNELNALSGAVA